MQHQLDTTLSDLNKFPLKLSDLVVMNCNPENAPEKLSGQVHLNYNIIIYLMLDYKETLILDL